MAACVSWGLYGPLAAYDLVPSTTTVGALSLTITAVFGAVLIGIGGARWLTNEVDKSLLKAAASNAARSPSSDDRATQIAVSTPTQALRISQIR